MMCFGGSVHDVMEVMSLPDARGHLAPHRRIETPVLDLFAMIGRCVDDGVIEDLRYNGIVILIGIGIHVLAFMMVMVVMQCTSGG